MRRKYEIFQLILYLTPLVFMRDILIRIHPECFIRYKHIHTGGTKEKHNIFPILL